MRLLKLIAYSLLGYVIYEIYQGFSVGSAQKARSSGNRGGWGSPGLRYAPVAGAGGAALPRQGKVVPVDEADGAHMNRVVGRGVVS